MDIHFFLYKFNSPTNNSFAIGVTNFKLHTQPKPKTPGFKTLNISKIKNTTTSTE